MQQETSIRFYSHLHLLHTYTFRSCIGLVLYLKIISIFTLILQKWLKHFCYGSFHCEFILFQKSVGNLCNFLGKSNQTSVSITFYRMKRGGFFNKIIGIFSFQKNRQKYLADFIHRRKFKKKKKRAGEKYKKLTGKVAASDLKPKKTSDHLFSYHPQLYLKCKHLLQTSLFNYVFGYF